MSYTPKTWSNGDTITAADLNHLENGVAGAGAVMIVNCPWAGTQTLDKTFAEIYTALKDGIPCYLKFGTGPDDTIDDDYATEWHLVPIDFAYKYDTTYRVYAIGTLSQYSSSLGITVGVPVTYIFSAAVSTDYPTILKRGYVLQASMGFYNGLH